MCLAVFNELRLPHTPGSTISDDLVSAIAIRTVLSRWRKLPSGEELEFVRRMYRDYWTSPRAQRWVMEELTWHYTPTKDKKAAAAAKRSAAEAEQRATTARPKGRKRKIDPWDDNEEEIPDEQVPVHNGTEEKEHPGEKEALQGYDQDAGSDRIEVLADDNT